MPTLSMADQRRARVRSQLLAGGSGGTSPAAVADWFAAMQAQDLESGLWSFGVRLPDLDRAGVEQAVAAGEVLRTWPMRGTIHFVAAQDASWLLQTTGRKALRAVSTRWRNLGLDAATAHRAADIFAQRLSGGRRLTRAALLAALEQEGIDTSGQRGYHLLWYASQIAVICIGPNEGSQQTFAMLSEWAPQQRRLDGQEALAELALRYFRSHGPTTRQDFMGWSGLSAAEAKAGIGAAGDALVAIDGAERPLIAAPQMLDGSAAEPVVRLLPGFDEFVLGYKDRSLFLPAGRMIDVVPGGNGVFRPTVMADGLVIGTWTRKLTKAGASLTVAYFEEPGRQVKDAVAQAAEGYGKYLGVAVRQ